MAPVASVWIKMPGTPIRNYGADNGTVTWCELRDRSWGGGGILLASDLSLEGQLRERTRPGRLTPGRPGPPGQAHSALTLAALRESVNTE